MLRQAKCVKFPSSVLVDRKGCRMWRVEMDAKVRRVHFSRKSKKNRDFIVKAAMESPSREENASTVSSGCELVTALIPKTKVTDQNVHSPDEFQQLVERNKRKVIVLMCKALSCRPCKAFRPQYRKVADLFKDVLFVEVTGDENLETRKMMIAMEVKSTPTFFIYRGGKKVHMHTGMGKDKLIAAIKNQLPVKESSIDDDHFDPFGSYMGPQLQGA